MKALRFEKCARQGDLLIRRVDTIPADAVVEPPVNGRHVLAHSETGHDHAVEASMGLIQYRSENPLLGFLDVIGDTPVLLEHHRAWDTHVPIEIGPGKYEIRRQREHTPEGWRRVED